MKAKFIKTGYAVLAALLLTTQLIAAPIALGAEPSGQADSGVIVPHNECQNGGCGAM